MKIHDLTLTALLTAFLCVVAPWAVPAGPIPLSLATFGVYLVAAVGGLQRGTLAVLAYILLGAAGAPVFAGFAGGAQRLLGPTGGYLAGYVAAALCTGGFADRFPGRRWPLLLGMLLGTAALYALGTAWYMVQTESSLGSALLLCVLPFLPGDTVKIAAAGALALPLRLRLGRAAML